MKHLVRACVLLTTMLCLSGCSVIISDSSMETVAEENNVIMELLEESGVDTSSLKESIETEGGGTLLGDALPTKQYRTLFDAETAYGNYLGLHNKIDSITSVELVDIYIINGDTLHAIYEDLDESRTITVKTSMNKKASELSAVYNQLEEKTVYIGDTAVYVGVSEEGKNKLAYFDTANGKGYSLYTEYGLAEEELSGLLIELIANLKSMPDWI